MQCLGFSPRLLGMALLTVTLLAQVDVNGFAFPNHLRRSSQQTSITAKSGNVANILLLQRQKPKKSAIKDPFFVSKKINSLRSPNDNRTGYLVAHDQLHGTRWGDCRSHYEENDHRFRISSSDIKHFTGGPIVPPAFVVAWIALTVLVGTFEAASRVGDYTYRDVRRHLWIALATSGDPWFAPRTWIPVSGMLFGNVLTAATIAASSLTSQLVTQQNGIEWQLCRGASVKEALQETRRVAATNALTPVLNMLSVAGVVHVPGMMTGQLLAGQAPYQAAAYQVVIFFLIAATASTTSKGFHKGIWATHPRK
ncbi:predicted protein [Phaeodactylum tricornutum CCAP 1055/1]|uniref:Uncharacterized protein n=2 Tax=Phaeodactylum tricornutum TaxID=2850 RepID=B7S409_PHATC|nr:predicted protein [Phaeodactylum tricornutum CCAP 1055/1]EEC42684.1 predicted protein [Phaeodactylum tricornutum CCAP 1055/1]|eukprot:XP_002176292.1 predicted protein [Phaeodactylum tricornutum CCAP 1055/1]